MANKSWIVTVGIYRNADEYTRRGVGECCIEVIEHVTRAPHRRAAVRRVDRIAMEHWAFDDECWLETISVIENVNGYTNERLAMGRFTEAL